MAYITPAQRKALKRVFDRTPLTDWEYRDATAAWCNRPANRRDKIKSYKQFRKTVVHSFDCIMVPWSGMWLGIEKDGYTHS